MAEINANSLPAKTELGANDSAIVVDQTSNAGALVDLDVLADKVLDRISSKTYTNQVGGSSAATLLAQLSTLNSNIAGSNIECTPESGFEVVIQSGAIVGNLVYGHIDIRGTIPATTWTDVGTLQIAARPKTSIHVDVILRSTGIHGGMARINAYGKISVFTRTAIDNADFAFTFVYNKEQAI